VKIRTKWAALGCASALLFSATGFVEGFKSEKNGSRALSSLSAPRTGMKITRDAALYDQIKQLDLERAAEPSFEDELSRLSSQEGRYKEKLPGLAAHPRLKSAVKRLSAGPYRARR
jgi:hypothetical protein